MGFSELWAFVKEHCADTRTVTFDWRKGKGDKPWIVIDKNNVVYHFCDTAGGHISLLEERLERFFSAIVGCGARICVVKDGPSHCAQRCVLKLERMLSKIPDVMNTVNVSLESDVAMTLAYAVFDRVLDTQFGQEGGSSDMLEAITADGEADPEIRMFCRRKLSEGHSVYVMSGDASLLLGLDPDREVHAIGMDSLCLMGGGAAGQHVLSGKLYRLRDVLRRLGDRANDILTGRSIPPSSPVTGEMLPYVAALLGGETSWIRSNYSEQPYPILGYIKAFLGRYEGKKIHWKIHNLYLAVVAVRGWLIRNAAGRPEQFVEGIASHAQRALNNNRPTETLHGLHSWSITNRGICNAASSLLHAAGLGDIRPGGFSNPAVRRAVAAEVRGRRDGLLDLGPPLLNNRQTEWGCYASFEVSGEDTGSLLSPLATLSEQIDFLLADPDPEMRGVGIAPMGVRAVGGESPSALFNSFLRPIVASISAGGRGEGEDCLILMTRNELRMPRDGAVTIADLNNTYVLQGMDLPLEGVIVKEGRDPMGLRFFALQGDTLDRSHSYCREDPRYEGGTATVGTLLDLRHRAHYLTRLAGKGTALAVLGDPERAAAVLFERLGLQSGGQSGGVVTACMAISRCWLLLPCPADLRRRLVTDNPAADTAKLLFATVYCYAALFADTHLVPGGTLERDALLLRVATALIVCPLFSIHTPIGCPANDLFATSNLPPPDTCLPARAFSESVLKYNTQYADPTASTASKRLSSCVDQVLSQLTDLLGYSRTARKRQAAWVTHCRWYNLCGVQTVVNFMAGGGALLDAVRELTLSDDVIAFIEAATVAAREVTLALHA